MPSEWPTGEQGGCFVSRVNGKKDFKICIMDVALWLFFSLVFGHGIHTYKLYTNVCACFILALNQLITSPFHYLTCSFLY